MTPNEWVANTMFPIIAFILAVWVIFSTINQMVLTYRLRKLQENYNLDSRVLQEMLTGIARGFSKRIRQIEGKLGGSKARPGKHKKRHSTERGQTEELAAAAIEESSDIPVVAGSNEGSKK